MSMVKDVESAMERLDDHSPSQLSGWFEGYVSEKWEKRFTAAAQAGKLDKLGEAAHRAFEQGRCRPL